MQVPVSNYTKHEQPEGCPPEFWVSAEWVNGTGGTRVHVHDDGCEDAGGNTECCTDGLKCMFISMPWQQLTALAMWMLEQADIARARQLQEQG